MTDDAPTMRFEEHVEALLRKAYESVSRSSMSDSWATAVAKRLGTRGDVATLEEAGIIAGVTRERIRQVMAKIERFTAHANDHSQLRTAAMDIAKQLAERSPVAEPIGVLLAESGRTQPTLTGPGFLNILKLIGTSPRELIGTDLVPVDNWLVEESEVTVMKSVSMAAKHTSAYGMTTVEEIRQALATPDNPLAPADIRRILKAQDSIRWADGWLWVEKDSDGLRSNRLINTARAVLSVNSPQTVASVHAGCRRWWKFRNLDVLPPIDAMKAFFEASPHFVMKGELVEHIKPLDYRAVLGDRSVTMIDVLKSQPHQIMDRQSFTEACDEAGIASGTYTTWTTYAVWMERFGPNVWGLRGSNPNPAVIDVVRNAALKRSKTEPKRKKWAWEANGLAVQTFDIRTSFVNTGVMSFVPEIHNLLAGQQLTVLRSGKPVGTIELGEEHSFSWGWSPALKALHAQQGEVMRASVNVGARTVEVQLGGEELWNV